jgi:hypothetical protein
MDLAVYSYYSTCKSSHDRNLPITTIVGRPSTEVSEHAESGKSATLGVPLTTGSDDG